jgi:hypothetical protein
MALRVTLQAIPVMTGCDDREGYLVLSDGQLVAVLVRLADEMHEDRRGSWFVEAGFGPCRTAVPPMFGDLDEARAWVRETLAG